MRKPTRNLIIDCTLLTCFVFLVSTGILMHYILPPRSGRYLSILGFNRHDWELVHFWIAVIFLSSLCIHLYIHRNWILCNIRGKKRSDAETKKRVVLGIVGLLALLLIALIPLLSPIQRNDFTPHRGYNGGKNIHVAPKGYRIPRD